MNVTSREIECLIYQARTARNHYEIEDCLDLIDDMREVLEKMMQEEKIFICGSGHGKTLSGWQPIETAPKDGTWVLLCGGDTRESEPDSKRPVVANWCPAPKYLHCEFEGWWEYQNVGYGGSYENPTHWMPLPEPPIE